MGLFKRLDKHAGLVSEMSETVGVKWDEVIAQDPEMAVKYREAVMKCTHCRDAGACQGWLKTHETAAHTPGYCENAALLGELAGG